jgi:hypothetical protein
MDPDTTSEWVTAALANQYAVSFAALGGGGGLGRVVDGDNANDGAVVEARLEEDSLVRWHTDAAMAGEGVQITGVDAVSGATSVTCHFIWHASCYGGVHRPQVGCDTPS